MESRAVGPSARYPSVSGGCYRVQVLVVGHQKSWREEAAQAHGAGFQATVCDRGVDAMTVLALGLPVDVLVIDAALQGSLGCTELAVEARALRPNLRIVFAGDEGGTDPIPDAFTVERDRLAAGEIVGTVRDVLAGRLA